MAFTFLCQSISFGQVVSLKVHDPNASFVSLSLNSGFNFNFNFLPRNLSEQQKKLKTKELLDYFFTSLSIDYKDLWVNLNPNDPSRIIGNTIADTDLGKALLVLDLKLKKDTAFELLPGYGKNAKTYWDKVFTKAKTLEVKTQNEKGKTITQNLKLGPKQQNQTTNYKVPTTFRVWIVPDEARVYETDSSITIVKATLKVLLESEYLEKSQIPISNDKRTDELKNRRTEELQEYCESHLKQLILPELTQRVNQDKAYEPLRQIYQALIFAQWYKKSVKSKAKSEKLEQFIKTYQKTNNLKFKPEQIYKSYLNSTKGEYKLVDVVGAIPRNRPIINGRKHGFAPTINHKIRRTYASGGVLFAPTGEIPTQLATAGEAGRVPVTITVSIGQPEDIGAEVSDVKNLKNLLRILRVLARSKKVPELSQNASNREIVEYCITQLDKLGAVKTNTDDVGNRIIAINDNVRDQDAQRIIDVLKRWAINLDDGVQAINFKGTDNVWRIVGFQSTLDTDVLLHEQREIYYRKQGLNWIQAHNRVVEEQKRGNKIAEDTDVDVSEGSIGASCGPMWRLAQIEDSRKNSDDYEDEDDKDEDDDKGDEELLNEILDEINTSVEEADKDSDISDLTMEHNFRTWITRGLLNILNDGKLRKNGTNNPEVIERLADEIAEQAIGEGKLDENDKDKAKEIIKRALSKKGLIEKTRYGYSTRVPRIKAGKRNEVEARIGRIHNRMLVKHIHRDHDGNVSGARHPHHHGVPEGQHRHADGTVHADHHHDYSADAREQRDALRKKAAETETDDQGPKSPRPGSGPAKTTILKSLLLPLLLIPAAYLFRWFYFKFFGDASSGDDVFAAMAAMIGAPLVGGNFYSPIYPDDGREGETEENLMAYLSKIETFEGSSQSLSLHQRPDQGFVDRLDEIKNTSNNNIILIGHPREVEQTIRSLAYQASLDDSPLPVSLQKLEILKLDIKKLLAGGVFLQADGFEKVVRAFVSNMRKVYHDAEKKGTRRNLAFYIDAEEYAGILSLKFKLGSRLEWLLDELLKSPIPVIIGGEPKTIQAVFPRNKWKEISQIMEYPQRYELSSSPEFEKEADEILRLLEEGLPWFKTVHNELLNLKIESDDAFEFLKRIMGYTKKFLPKASEREIAIDLIQKLLVDKNKKQEYRSNLDRAYAGSRALALIGELEQANTPELVEFLTGRLDYWVMVMAGASDVDTTLGPSVRISEEEVLTALAKEAQTTVSLLTGDIRARVDRFKENLAKRYVGHEHVVDAILAKIRLFVNGQKEPNKPIGVFMLAGPTGVEKPSL
ncbi:MAG: hypothetical protein AB1755_02935 [Candidatus Omnitrophota bacterium]